ncbi:MAG: Two-component sensor histidine kinase [candidate division WS6 bacterium GW2011_GWA2_37_6]|uniref:histidine kinase n=1 Tax=candidate division WS6 bacterium GW2011_GWA2_37_6 TaxID=1619087 RepID=A0A0G0K3N3_9BACT|nr:MAG: Two-component sensor histidine kinase [candidate division WS6 bacterium GW2011_GWA2_37_6]
MENNDKALIRDLKSKNLALEETLRRERDMLDILGHELRTPLTISKNAVMLLMKDQKQNKYLEMAHENIDRELKLLDTLLSTTKIDNDAIELKSEKVDFIDVVDDSLVAMRGKADKKGLDISFDKPSSAYVVADRERIQEIVDNIIDNAIKYTDKGSVKISMKPAKEYVELSIKDTGRGMSEVDLKNLGKKFYRSNNYLESSKSSGMNIVRPGGTGLGLYVTFKLIKKLGGSVKIGSKLGKGSIFTVIVPAFHEGQKVEEGLSGKRMTVFEKFERMKEENKEKEREKEKMEKMSH